MSQATNDEFSQHLSDDEASNHEDASDTGVAPKQQQQVIPQTTCNTNIKLTNSKKEEYDIWGNGDEHYLERLFSNNSYKSIYNIQFKGLKKDMTIPTITLTLEAHDVDTLSIDDLYNNLRVFEQEIQGTIDLLHEDLEQIDDLDIEKMDINWQIAMIAIRMKKDLQQRGHDDGKKKRDSFYQHQEAGKQEKNSEVRGGGKRLADNGLLVLSLWREHTEDERQIMHPMAITPYSKIGLGYDIKSNNGVLSYEEKMSRSVFKCTEEDYVNKPLYSRFTKTKNFKGVPHPLSGDYTPKPQEEIDDSLYVYGKKGPQELELSVSDDRSSKYSTCQSNDSAGSIGTSSEHSVDLESENSRVPQEVYVSKPVTTNEKGVSAPKSKEVDIDHPLKNMVDRGIFDSGCLGHMIGNKDQLEDFEEFNGGSVTFGGSKGYITGKGRCDKFWQTTTATTLVDGTLELKATIDTIEYTITEASIKSKLQLADASGITMLPNNEIFEGMGHMGYPTDGSFTFWKSFFHPQWSIS
ncbi:hypothetical protein Tco_1493826 [Tanacetum coccineum]